MTIWMSSLPIGKNTFVDNVSFSFDGNDGKKMYVISPFAILQRMNNFFLPASILLANK